MAVDPAKGRAEVAGDALSLAWAAKLLSFPVYAPSCFNPCSHLSGDQVLHII